MLSWTLRKKLTTRRQQELIRNGIFQISVENSNKVFCDILFIEKMFKKKNATEYCSRVFRIMILWTNRSWSICILIIDGRWRRLSTLQQTDPNGQIFIPVHQNPDLRTSLACTCQARLVFEGVLDNPDMQFHSGLKTEESVISYQVSRSSEAQDIGDQMQ